MNTMQDLEPRMAVAENTIKNMEITNGQNLTMIRADISEIKGMIKEMRTAAVIRQEFDLLKDQVKTNLSDTKELKDGLNALAVKIAVISAGSAATVATVVQQFFFK